MPDPATVAGTNRVELTLVAAKAASVAGDHQRALALAQDAATIVDATADPAQAARVYERLGQYLGHAHQVEAALRAHARAVELVPADRLTPLPARVRAAMAQALMQTGRRDEARRWCDQALTAARDAGSADDEADALITLGVIEAYGDPASARSRFAAARARAAEVGNREIELRALHDLAWVESLLGNLPAARAVSDEGAELAQQSGLAWSSLGMAFRRGQRYVRYVAGAWDECERLAAAGPELVTTVPEGRLAAAGLVVSVARGRASAGKRLDQLAALAGADRYLDMDVAVLEAELATWPG